MTTPSTHQFAAGGLVDPAAAESTPRGHVKLGADVPAVAFVEGWGRAASASRFAQRLDRLDEELTAAQHAVADLVGRLGPVLPAELVRSFPPEATLARDPGEPPASPLGERLAAATERAFSLVHQVRAVCEAVDL